MSASGGIYSTETLDGIKIPTDSVEQINLVLPLLLSVVEIFRTNEYITATNIECGGNIWAGARAAALKGNGHPMVATVTDLLTKLTLVRLGIYAQARCQEMQCTTVTSHPSAAASVETKLTNAESK